MMATPSPSVVFMITEFGRGGAETQILRLAISLKARGWEPAVVSMMPPIGYFEELEAADIPLYSLDMTRGVPDPRGIWTMIRVLRERRPNVLACFCFHANILGAVAGRAARVPVITSSIRGERFGSRNRERLERTFDLLRLRDVLTTNSELVAKSLIDRNIASPGRTIVIPNGIVTQVYRSQPGLRESLRQELGLGPDDFFWLAVGNIRHPKDYPNLLRAFRQLRARHPRARLKIAGDLREPEAIANLEAEFFPEDRESVELLGIRQDIPALLGAANALVLSSAHEGLPNVIMEALASGTPVVATDVGGVRELVTEGSSGFVVPPHDSAALADGMAKMMALDPGMRDQMGVHGQEHIIAGYDLESVSRRWEELFSSLLEAKGKGARG